MRHSFWVKKSVSGSESRRWAAGAELHTARLFPFHGVSSRWATGVSKVTRRYPGHVKHAHRGFTCLKCDVSRVRDTLWAVVVNCPIVVALVTWPITRQTVIHVEYIVFKFKVRFLFRIYSEILKKCTWKFKVPVLTYLYLDLPIFSYFFGTCRLLSDDTMSRGVGQWGYITIIVFLYFHKMAKHVVSCFKPQKYSSRISYIWIIKQIKQRTI